MSDLPERPCFYDPQAEAIVFLGGGDYWIGINSCGNAEDMLGKILHLAEKTWVTTEHIECFIELAEQHAGVVVRR